MTPNFAERLRLFESALYERLRQGGEGLPDPQVEAAVMRLEVTGGGVDVPPRPPDRICYAPDAMAGRKISPPKTPPKATAPGSSASSTPSSTPRTRRTTGSTARKP